MLTRTGCLKIRPTQKQHSFQCEWLPLEYIAGPWLWNSLPARICQPDNDIGEFRQQLKSFSFKWHRGASWLSVFVRLFKYSYSLTHSHANFCLPARGYTNSYLCQCVCSLTPSTDHTMATNLLFPKQFDDAICVCVFCNILPMFVCV